MARSGWCRSYVDVATLLRTRMEVNRCEAQEPSNELLEDLTMKRWRRDLSGAAGENP